MVCQLEADVLGLNDEEKLDVLDLPQLYSRPSATTLLSTLADLKSQPSSWENTPRSGNSRSISGTSTPLKGRKIKSEGLPAYLTKIVSSALPWIDDETQKEEIWETASSELSARSGRSAQGDLTRTFSIPLSQEHDTSIELIIYEPALTADNTGHKTWASSYLLAKRLCSLKAQLPIDSILELGAGTGLVGMAAACVLGAHVTMTDLPEIVPNLDLNISRNAEIIHSYGGTTAIAVLDWRQPESLIIDGRQCSPGAYTLLLAADVVYSQEHPRLLTNAVQYHMRKSADARLLLEIPVRDGFNAELSQLRHELSSIGMTVLHDGEEHGFDDWSGRSDDEQMEVICWWSVWKWL